MTEAASFDLIPTATMTKVLLQRSDDNESSPPFNENFEELGYDSINFFDTLSDMFYYELFFGSLTVVACTTKLLYDKVNRKAKGPFS